MNAILPWLIVFGGPILGAVTGAIGMHFHERIHWHRLAQTWYDDGYDAGWAAAKRQYGTMVPDMVFTQAGTLEAIPPADSGLLAQTGQDDRVRCDSRTATDTRARCYDPEVCQELGACLKFNDDGAIRADPLPVNLAGAVIAVEAGDQLAEAAAWDTLTLNLGAEFTRIKAALYLP